MAVFWYGFLGGLAVNLLRLGDIARLPKPDRPETFSDWMYCIQFISLPMLGGLMAHAYHGSGSPLTPILAINVGASAPAILKTMAGAVPRGLSGRRVN
jgi:hypothetical protein